MILKHLAMTTVRSRVIKYRIVSKVVPKSLDSASWRKNEASRRRTNGQGSEREESLASPLDTWFEDRGTVRHNKLGARNATRIGFKFAGCRPMPVRRKTEAQEGEAEQKSNGVTSTAAGDRSRVIVARRKLLRPLTNLRNVVPRVYDLSSFHF